jgi:hypothetical protein
MSHTATFRNWPEAHGWLTRLAEWTKANTQQGRPVTITAKEVKRSLPQNAHIHPVVGRIAKMLERPTDTESLRRLRRLLLEQWCNDTGRQPEYERSIDGERWVSVDKGTSDLDKPDCTEFIDWLLATEAELEAA